MFADDSSVAGRVVNGLARWDGTGWKERPPAFSGGPGMPTVVETMTEWDDALIMGGQLHITGPDSTN
jgi:hypothetical protein